MPEEAFLTKKLEKRRQDNAFRTLQLPDGKVDFSSNDYLGIARNDLILQRLSGENTGVYAKLEGLKTGSTGSRLLTGHYALIDETERAIAAFHEAPAGLIYNSGYDANVGLLSCVPQRGDTVLYDYLSHASLRDGIRLSRAFAFSFRHNDMDDLLKKLKAASGTTFVVTESVFSMDGDKAPLKQLAHLCEQYGAHLIVDEAHATGVIGLRGEGLVQFLGLEKQIFARIHTFGKACGAHGAIVLGTENLRDYLINFSRPFIYTTALPESTLAAISASYKIFPALREERNRLAELIAFFQASAMKYSLFRSETPIQAIVVTGNAEVKELSKSLQACGMDVRPILYPTVPEGSERLRIVLHSFNNRAELERMIELLQ